MGFGDVGTVAIDLLAYNNDEISKIGYYKSQYLQSVVGNSDSINDFQSLSLPGEIYEAKGYIFLQFRGKVRAGRRKQFLEELRDFLKQHEFSEIIILGASSEQNKLDISQEGKQIFCVPFPNYKGKAIDQTEFKSGQELFEAQKNDEFNEVLTGTGLARVMYKAEDLFTGFKFLQDTDFIQTFVELK
ncbi:hypothetical protein PPERSA_11191 [Pseudocohnilembus persalinus]|uniref:Proteasome assembly chaperone 2 n=1 Tax=Pseudocohnilembus persalinus TaxID=266149 RepID=A0A0V0R013_PSEPJ|nr:hypothetical protein PPERSA_11191 [Pseudocohnilembus persalinus]|eukprot:KRX07642.1 hypothetical protein PPERSA_11191 [Pseudocohnilembus persalinus]